MVHALRNTTQSMESPQKKLTTSNNDRWLPYCFGSGWHELSHGCTKLSRPCLAIREMLDQNKGVGTLSNDAIALRSAQPNCLWPSSATALPRSSKPSRRSERHPPCFPSVMTTVTSLEWILPKALPTTSSLWRYSFLLMPFAPLTSSFLWNFSNKVHFSNQ